MALVTCGVCRRAFINGPEGETTCPECMARLQELYPVVRGFLRDNATTPFTIYQLSQALDIDVKEIEGLVALGLIEASGFGRRHRKGDSKKR